MEKDGLQVNPHMDRLFQDAIDLMKSKGAIIIEVELYKQLKQIGKDSFTVLLYEFKAGVNKYLSNANCKMKTVADVIEFNKKNEAKAMPFFKQEILESCEQKGPLSDKEYKDALALSTSARKIIDDILQQNKLDAVCGTSIGLAGCIDLVNGDYDTGFYFCPPAAMAGYPHIT
ncbi:MAG: amidase, partial [Mucilaginibacter sp.]